MQGDDVPCHHPEFIEPRGMTISPKKPRASGKIRTPSPDPTRDIAFDIVRGVLEDRRMLETSLFRATQNTQTEARDRAAGHRLGATTIRNLGTLSVVLEPFLRKQPPEAVRAALLLGAAQLLCLDTPPHAAVGTIVDLLRRRGLTPFAGLANAVLRKVATGGASLLEGLDRERLDIPPWLWTSWKYLGRGVPRAISRGLDHEAPIDLTLRPGTLPPEGSVVLPGGSCRLPAGTRIAELPGYAEGEFWVQDVAAAWPARLLNARPGEHVADLCAAPGGKTAQLAMTGATVTAVERDETRVTRLQENITRLRLNVETVVADATEWKPTQPLDAILLDAPCSASGTARRHPDVLWIKRPRDITALKEGQIRLLEAAFQMLKPGGRLIYAVCSLQEEEGPAQIESARQIGFKPVPFTEEELQDMPEARTPEGWFRTHPGLWLEQGSMDGFFAVRFIKPA
jgi:16S rRNA (cytosine967-C5)-methyltransferase